VNKQKKKRTFFKIREKMVLVQPSKGLPDFRIVGIFLFILGILFLGVALGYKYLFPAKHQDKPLRVVEVPVEKIKPFIPERVLLPRLNLDYLVKTSTPEGELVPKETEVVIDDEIILLDLDGQYKKYLVSDVEVKLGTSSGDFKVDKTDLNLILPIKVKPAKELWIVAKLLAE